jgi:hypothetical protein
VVRAEAQVRNLHPRPAEVDVLEAHLISTHLFSRAETYAASTSSAAFSPS